MAEGGTDNTEYPKDLYVNSRSLECPICLEQLRKPKSLPCLHSFCQECLSSYINKELSENVGPPASFSCPVCRKTTYPISQSDEIAKWAQQFPTNTLVVEILENQRLDKDPNYCTPCKKKGNTGVQPHFLCETTKSFFCNDCKTSFHDAVHLNCDAVVLMDGEIPMMKKNTNSVRCTIHKKKMDYYCEDHKFLGCSKCITLYHRKCDVVSTTEDYVQKNSSQIDHLMESLEKGASSMECLIVGFKQQCESLLEERDVAMDSITDLRAKIDKCLDKMQREITDDLMGKIKDINQEIEISRQECERLKLVMQGTLEAKERANNKDDHMQMILLFQKGQGEISSCENMIKEMKKSCTIFNVKHEVSPDLDTVTKNCVLSIGEIVVIKSPRNLPIDLFKAGDQEEKLSVSKVQENYKQAEAKLSSVSSTQTKSRLRPRTPLEWQPFPKRWYNEGLLITNTVLKKEQAYQARQTQDQCETSGATAGTSRYGDCEEDQPSRKNGPNDRKGVLNHPTKGRIPTYIYQRKHNVHFYYNKELGQWMRMPIGWELHHKMVGRLVDQLEEMLPTWGDRGDILALLRQCNYDIDECIATYLHLEGDPWLKVVKTSKD